jgi:hypothetical protein
MPKDMKFSQGRLHTGDGRFVLNGKADPAKGNYVKDGKRGKWNEKSKEVEYESDKGLTDLGQSSGPAEPAKNDVYYPSISLDLDKFDALADAPIGDEVKLQFVAKVKGINESDQKRCINLELRRAGLLD